MQKDDIEVLAIYLNFHITNDNPLNSNIYESKIISLFTVESPELRTVTFA